MTRKLNADTLERAESADRGDTRPATPLGTFREGDEIHFRTPVSAWGYVHARGESVVLTADMIAQSINRLGESWLDRADGPDARIGRGPWPTDEHGEPLPTWEYGSAEWELARQRASAEAWTEPNYTTRRAKLDAVERRFGPMPTSWSHRSSGNARAVEQQQRERAESGVQYRAESTSSDGSR